MLGVLSMGAFLVVLASGAVLGLEGPTWWHTSGSGRFVNSLHLWSTELFFLFMVVHLWAKFFMAAWRGRGGPTWITGAVAFLISIPSAFTGYLTQQNFDAQWIAIEAKDGLNAAGIGAFFNPLDDGQMLLWHVLFLPVALGLLIWLHLRLVRRRGLVPPLPEDPE
jgi:ubiquinol-cytochrome c reductase cytochrome b subunit